VDTLAACCMLCVTITMVTSDMSSEIVSSIGRVEVGSNAEHGSSMSSTRGRMARPAQCTVVVADHLITPPPADVAIPHLSPEAAFGETLLHEAVFGGLVARVPVQFQAGEHVVVHGHCRKWIGLLNTIPISRRASVSFRRGS